MLTLITGNPRTGKTLYTVSELLGSIPGSRLELAKGGYVPRVLYSNIKDLLIEHEHMGADELNSWHSWATAGAVICFDEVQEVWRPRSFGTKVPDAIAAIETHGHLGVDIILITQHPMLLDANIRRLVNRHIHVRRLSAGVVWLYEWDHCSNPHQTKSCVSTRMWRYNKKAFQLYKSSDAHTKPVTRPPMVALLAVPALACAGYFGFQAYQNVAGKSADVAKVDAPPAVESLIRAGGDLLTPSIPSKLPAAPDVDAVPSPAQSLLVEPQRTALLGCVATATSCRCYGGDGLVLTQAADACRVHVSAPSPVKSAAELKSAFGGDRFEDKPSGGWEATDAQVVKSIRHGSGA